VDKWNTGRNNGWGQGKGEMLTLLGRLWWGASSTNCCALLFTFT